MEIEKSTSNDQETQALLSKNDTEESSSAVQERIARFKFLSD